MSLIDLLKEKVEKQMAAHDEQLKEIQAKARARKAWAKDDAAGTNIEKQFLAQVNDIKEKMTEWQVYLNELVEAGEDKAEEIKSKATSFFE